jgi:hypothetical protein
MLRRAPTLRCCSCMATLAQYPITPSWASPFFAVSCSDHGLSDCFLTYANHLVEQIFVEHGIEVTRNAKCEAA